MSALAQLIDAIPIVQSTADRGTRFASPTTDQRVFNKGTGNIERWNGASWITDFTGEVSTQDIVPAGTAALPGLAFIGDTTSGLYDAAVGTVAVSVSAVGRAQWTTTAYSPVVAGGLTLGTASLPWSAAYLGSIISSADGPLIQRTGVSTSAQFLRLANTTGDFYFGVESSVSGSFFTGSTAYDSVLYSPNPINLIVSAVSRVRISSGGVVLGTDPGGTDLLRVGGTTRLNGFVGQGASGASHSTFFQFNTGSGDGTSYRGFNAFNTINATVGNFYQGFYSEPTTAAAAFTVNAIAGFFAADTTKGAGSTINTQYGMYIASQTKGATNYAIFTNAGRIVFGGNSGILNAATSVVLNFGAGDNFFEASDGTRSILMGVSSSTAVLLGTYSNHSLNIISNNLLRWSLSTAGNLVADPTNGGTVQSRIGTSSTVAKHPSVLGTTFNASTTSTSEVSLASFTLPANALAVNGQICRVIVHGIATTQNATIVLKFGATSVISATTITAGNRFWIMWNIVRTGAATEQMDSVLVQTGATGGGTSVTAAETLSGAVTIDLRGSVVAGGTLTYTIASAEIVAT